MQMNNPTEVTDYGFSTHVAVDKIEEYISGDGKDTDTILINLYTLIRNRTRKGMSVSEIHRETNEDITQIISAIRNSASVKTTIIFYMYDYTSVLPKGRVKPLTKAREMQWIAYNTYKRQMKDTVIDYQDVIVMYSCRKSRLLPHVLLSSDVKGLNNGHKIAMISHMPLDWHLFRKYNKSILVQSWTGEVLTYKDFGRKLWKNEFVPFCEATHNVLGDSETLICTLKPKAKRAMFEKAEKQRWNLIPLPSVKAKIKAGGFITPLHKYPFN